MKNLQAVFLILILVCMYSPCAFSNDMPKQLIGVWGDEEMCIAYHRNDFFYDLTENGKLSLKRGDNIDDECAIINLEKSADGQWHGQCNRSELQIWPSTEDNKLHMKLGNSVLSKCAASDIILGIGKDPKDIDGDLGFARHAGFTIGYGTAAASYCDYHINEDVAQRTLAMGAEVAEKYAYANRLLPPEIWSQKLMAERSQLGIDAFHIDKGAIPNICGWIVKAYGESGWVIDGFIKEHPTGN